MVRLTGKYANTGTGLLPHFFCFETFGKGIPVLSRYWEKMMAKTMVLKCEAVTQSNETGCERLLPESG